MAACRPSSNAAPPPPTRGPGLQNGTNYQFRVTAINAAGRSDPSPWSDPEHPLREPGGPGVPVAARGNRYIDLSWAPSNPNGDPVIEYQVEMGSNPGVWVPVGTSTSYRWSNLANGVAQQFRVRSRNRDPDWSPISGFSTPVVPVRGTAAAAGARRPARRRRGRRHLPAPGRRGLRDHGRAGPRQRRCHAGRRRVAAHVHRPRQRHRLLVRRACPERGRHGARGAPASNVVVPAGPPIGPGSINASSVGRGRGRPQLAGRQRQRQRAHAVPDLRQRVGRGRRARDVDAAGRSRRQHHVLVRRPGVQRRRVRRVVARPPGDDQRTAQPAERTERLGQGRQHDRGQLGHPERQRPRGRQLRRRHRSGRLEVGQRHEHDVERHPRQQLPGPRPGLQRGRLRAVERVEPDTSRPRCSST